jgi:hypothetical protein
MSPSFLRGMVFTLLASIRSARIIFGRLSRGSITSSFKSTLKRACYGVEGFSIVTKCRKINPRGEALDRFYVIQYVA